MTLSQERILKELPDTGIRAITQIFKCSEKRVLPGQWKVSQIITFLKTGKPADEAKSYISISLLPYLSKLFEKSFLKRIKPTLQEKRFLPDHQFGFRQKHATIEQIHRITNVINKALESIKYCSAAFLDISQAFDKVWHEEVLYKIKKNIFSDSIYKILKSYHLNNKQLTQPEEVIYIYIFIYINKDLLHRNQWRLHMGLQIVPITNLPLLSL
jgi:hypothetical protein